jgi:pimeloyl-ACP methyl ester carboxylesterase
MPNCAGPALQGFLEAPVESLDVDERPSARAEIHWSDIQQIMSRTTLVLLPGLDGTGDLFAPVVNALGPSVPTQIVRYPLSDASDYATCEAIARASLPTDRSYVLLGESFSGPIAVSIAATAPPRLGGLILCSTFVCNPQPYLRPLRPLLSILPVHSAPLCVSRFLILGGFATPALRNLHQQTLRQARSSDSQRRGPPYPPPCTRSHHGGNRCAALPSAMRAARCCRRYPQVPAD